MKVQTADHSNGILDFKRGLGNFSLERFAVAPELSPWVESYWSVSWNLDEGKDFQQNNLSSINCNIVVEPDGLWFYGVPDRIFKRRLTGSGRVLGIKFLPGGFFPFVNADVSQWTGKQLPLQEIFTSPIQGWPNKMKDGQPFEELIEQLEYCLLRQKPEKTARSTKLVQFMRESDPSMRIHEIAYCLNMDDRTLQRLLIQEVGVSPKEILKRFRLQMAAERLLREPKLPCGELALALGYSDQAHFTRDFKAVIGRSPGEYQNSQLR